MTEYFAYSRNPYKIGNLFVLFEFRPCKLTHVSPCALVWYVCRTSNYLSPQRQCTLSLDELRISQRLRYFTKSWTKKSMYMVES